MRTGLGNRGMGGSRSNGNGYGYKFRMYEPVENKFVEAVAKQIVTDFTDFKEVILQAITQYQAKIKNEFFRSAGRARAKKLESVLRESKDFLDVIIAIKETIKYGNENADSFKTILYCNLVNKYCDNKRNELGKCLYELHAEGNRYSSFLASILNHKMVYDFICRQTIAEQTTLPHKLVDLTISYSS